MKESLIVNETYPGFKHPASRIAAFMYARSLAVFIVALANLGGHDWFAPPDHYHFYSWLNQHCIREIKVAPT